MRDSLIILLIFCVGVVLGRLGTLPWLLQYDLALPILWGFMFLAGLAIGRDPALPQILRGINGSVLLLPLATTVGTFVGAGIASLVISLALTDCLAIGSGFGYYSLSSIFIARLKGSDLGTVALLCNVLRELVTLVCMPLLVRFFGPLPAIGCGGCTTMDTTLPVITRYAGVAYVFPAVIHAMILDLSVPFWVTLFCSI